MKGIAEMSLGEAERWSRQEGEMEKFQVFRRKLEDECRLTEEKS